jgi:hypothetical protein
MMVGIVSVGFGCLVGLLCPLLGAKRTVKRCASSNHETATGKAVLRRTAHLTHGTSSNSGRFLRLVQGEPIAIEVAGEKLIGCAPEIESELAELEIAEGALDVVLVGFEVQSPLLEGEVIAPAVVMNLHELKLGPGELV